MSTYGVNYGDYERRIAAAVADEFLLRGIGVGGEGEGGTASATNQLTQITLETAIRDRLPSALVDGRLVVNGSGVTQPISVSVLPLPDGAATETTLTTVKNALTNRVSRTSWGASTSVTPNAWSQVMPLNANRYLWYVHNPASNSVNIEIGLKVGGVTFAISSLVPGGTHEESLPHAISPDEIMVRSASASVTFYAMEA